jgi:hypothetical protein
MTVLSLIDSLFYSSETEKKSYQYEFGKGFEAIVFNPMMSQDLLKVLYRIQEIQRDYRGRVLSSIIINTLTSLDSSSSSINMNVG